MNRRQVAAWPSSRIFEGDGVLVAADISQEWLLPWWWEFYRRHNAYKVVFIDFGMSFDQKKWCEERGMLIPLRLCDDFVTDRSEMDPAVVRAWNEAYGKNFWESRISWFKKPLACLQTPFKRTLWIDLDCEIRGSVGPLFRLADESPGIAMAEEQVCAASDYPLYNSGVISFQNGTPLLAEWALGCLELSARFRSDDAVFCHLIDRKKAHISTVPPLYNWSRCNPPSADAVIIHWHGHHGKETIRNRIHLASLADYS